MIKKLRGTKMCDRRRGEGGRGRGGRRERVEEGGEKKVIDERKREDEEWFVLGDEVCFLSSFLGALLLLFLCLFTR